MKMIAEKLGLDTRDLKIISWFMQNPNISQNEIAERLKLSQPSVNARIKKLKDKAVLNVNVGVEFNKSNLFLARVDFTAKDPHNTLERLRNCTYFVNGFIMSGKNNVSIFIVNSDLRKIESIINEQLRGDQQVSDINVNIVVSTAKDFVFGLRFDPDCTPERCKRIEGCIECINTPKHYKKNKLAEKKKKW